MSLQQVEITLGEYGYTLSGSGIPIETLAKRNRHGAPVSPYVVPRTDTRRNSR